MLAKKTNLVLESAGVIDGALSEYKHALYTAYGNPNALGYKSPDSINKFIKHIRPLLIDLYAAVKSKSDDGVINAFEEFLLNFSEIGVHPRNPELKPHIMLISSFYNDASDWGMYYKPSTSQELSIEEQCNTLTGRKLDVLSKAGVMESKYLGEFEKARINSAYANFPGEIPGCFDHSIAWFNNVLGYVPNEIVFDLRDFYRQLIKPTIAKLDAVKAAVERGDYNNLQ